MRAAQQNSVFTTTDFTIATVTGGYYNQILSLLVQRNTDGSGWLAPDIKIPYLADKTGTTPSFYLTTGVLPAITSDEEGLKKALHYEYAIEIDGAGGAFVPFTFMRRNNLLIGGTATEFPLPQLQLELTKNTVYTFGSKGFFGEKGSNGEIATASNEGWKSSE